MKTTQPVAQLYPPEVRDALVRAGDIRDIARIDALTDNLVRRGFCRPRQEYRIEPANRWSDDAQG